MTHKDKSNIKSDNVHSPNHYQLMDGVEAIDVIKSVLGDNFKDYCIGNVIKYVLRADKKNKIEDLEKAKVYLQWSIDVESEKE